MSVRELTINPAGQKGYGIFLEDPKSRLPQIYVMTENYAKYILVRQNMEIGKGLNINYDPPRDGSCMKICEWTHAVYMAQNWIDRTPHMVEKVDFFRDFKVNETDQSKAIVEVQNRHNVMFGQFLDPPYPEMLPALRIPIPTSPLF